MQLFSTAVCEFSKDFKAKFDFIEVAIRDHPLPNDYPNHIHEFFTLVYNYYKANGDPYSVNDGASKVPSTSTGKGMSNQDAFEKAVERLSERLPNSFLHHIVRNKINVPAGISKALDEQFEKVDALIRELMPCSATKQYDNVGLVHCEFAQGPRGKESHGDMHQSAQTHLVQIPREGLLKFLGPNTARQQCRWEGKFSAPEKYTKPKWFFDPLPITRAGIVTEEEFLPKFKQVLASQKKIFPQIKTTRVCLACLLATPTEVLGCNHTLCKDCCKELNTKCPFCDEKGAWVAANRNK
jgi:hypothetical protein